MFVVKKSYMFKIAHTNETINNLAIAMQASYKSWNQSAVQCSVVYDASIIQVQPFLMQGSYKSTILFAQGLQVRHLSTLLWFQGTSHASEPSIIQFLEPICCFCSLKFQFRTILILVKFSI